MSVQSKCLQPKIELAPEDYFDLSGAIQTMACFREDFGPKADQDGYVIARSFLACRIYCCAYRILNLLSL